MSHSLSEKLATGGGGQGISQHRGSYTTSQGAENNCLWIAQPLMEQL